MLRGERSALGMAVETSSLCARRLTSILLLMGGDLRVLYEDGFSFCKLRPDVSTFWSFLEWRTL